MSRYNEEWQRRKAYLIRSLFNDIPYRVLSPVIEESTLSTNDKILEESEKTFTSSEDQSCSEYEPVSPPNTAPDIIPIPLTDSAVIDRPWSPLPPLIIEREPDRHDEPLEYYEKLLIKIKNIYKNLFLKGKRYDHDFFENDYEQNSSARSDLIMESSFYSNGYTADDESIDVEYSNNKIINRSKSIISDKSMRDDNNIDKRTEPIMNEINSENIDVNIELPDEEMQLDLSVPNEEPNYSQITIAADVHFDGQPLPEITPSPIYEEPLIEVIPVLSVNPNLMAHEIETNISSEKTSLQTIPVLADDIPEGEAVPSYEYPELMQLENLVRKDTLMQHLTPEFEELQPYAMQSSDPERQLEALQCLVGGHCAKSPVLKCKRQKQRVKDSIVSRTEGTDDLMVLEEQVGTSKQVTVQAEIHSEVPQDDSNGDERIVEIEQDSCMDERCSRPTGEYNQPSNGDSMIRAEPQAGTSNDITDQVDVHTEAPQRVRPVEAAQDSPVKVHCSRPTGEHSLRSDGDSMMLEDLQDPETVIAIENIEVMRTPRQAETTSQESIPGGNTRLTSDMELTCDHNTIAQDISNMTSQSQNGGHVKDTNEQKMSVDFDDIMATIFNDSNRVFRQSTENINMNRPLPTRKRRYEAVSAQTEGVSWNELRDNFFVGTPKIFRLCSCVNHICC